MDFVYLGAITVFLGLTLAMAAGCASLGERQ
jgi:hypothetical protein